MYFYKVSTIVVNILAVVLTAKMIKVEQSFVSIAEVTIIDLIDFNFRSSFKVTTFAVNVTGITYEIEYYKVSV